jgi:hypothetical protein
MSQVLYDRRAQVWEAYKALLDATADRTLSGQEKEAETRMSGELDELDEAISTQEKGKQRAALYDAADEPVTCPSARPPPAATRCRRASCRRSPTR